MTDRELLQQALDALEKHIYEYETIQALHTRLAQPEIKVFGWLEMDDISEECFVQLEEKPTWGGYWIPLYTAQPKKEWVGLTNEDRWELVQKTPSFDEVVAAVEAKLKEKNAA
jgi:hypothetical protein